VLFTWRKRNQGEMDSIMLYGRAGETYCYSSPDRDLQGINPAGMRAYFWMNNRWCKKEA
jgi:hypothetical protein